MEWQKTMRWARPLSSLESESKDISEDKEEMNRHVREHIANTLESIRTIWSSSDPELKKRMKTDLTALVGELTV